MDGMADISKILGIIMENPEIIEKIKEMAQGGEKGEENSSLPEEIKSAEPDQVPTAAPIANGTAEAAAIPKGRDKKRRHDLLCAIKPYVSAERGRAIDTMLSVVEVLEIMKTR